MGPDPCSYDFAQPLLLGKWRVALGHAIFGFIAAVAQADDGFIVEFIAFVRAGAAVDPEVCEGSAVVIGGNTPTLAFEFHPHRHVREIALGPGTGFAAQLGVATGVGGLIPRCRCSTAAGVKPDRRSEFPPYRRREPSPI